MLICSFAHLLLWGALPVALLAQDLRTMFYVEPLPPLGFSPEASDRVGLHLVTLIYSPLVDRDVNGMTQPRLLLSTQPTYAKNGIFRFPLKKGIRWFACDKEGKLIRDPKTEQVGFKAFTAWDVQYTVAQFREQQSVRFGFVIDLFSDVRAKGDDEVEFELRPRFSIPVDSDSVIRELDRGEISNRLRSDFAKNGIAFVSPRLQTEKQSQEWVIEDQEKTRDGIQRYTYVIRTPRNASPLEAFRGVRATTSANELRVVDVSGIDVDFVLWHLEFPIIPDLSGIDTTPFRRFRDHFVIGTGPFAMSEEGADGVRLVKTGQSLSPMNPQNEGGEPIARVVMIDRYIDLSLFDTIFAERKQQPPSPRYQLFTEIPLEGYNKIKTLLNSQNQEEKKRVDLLALQRHSINRMTYFAFNHEKVFKNEKLRKAFAYAFDKKRAFRLAYGKYFPEETNLPLRDIKKIIHSPLPSGQTPADIFIIPHDGEEVNPFAGEAKQDKTKAEADYDKWGLSSSPIEDEFKLLAHTEDEGELMLCTEFKNMIKKTLDIDIEIVTVTKDEWLKKTEKGDFEIAFGRADFTDQTNIIESLFGFSSRQNFSRYAGAWLFSLPKAFGEADRLATELTAGRMPDAILSSFTQNGVALHTFKITPYWRNGWLIEELEGHRIYAITRDDEGLHVFRNDLEVLIREYNESKNPTFRRQRLDDMARLIAKEMPYLFMARIPRFATYRKDILSGVKIEPFYFFTYIDQWYFQKEARDGTK